MHICTFILVYRREIIDIFLCCHSNISRHFRVCSMVHSISCCNRERNREHAKRSRIRKKFLLESLQQSVALLKGENDKLRNAITFHLGEEKAAILLNSKNINDQGLIAPSFADANKILDDPDFSFIKAIQTAQQNFVVTDPSLPDNPIVYATQGFLMLTGYTLDQASLLTTMIRH